MFVMWKSRREKLTFEAFCRRKGDGCDMAGWRMAAVWAFVVSNRLN
jgi:hypothetical protein